MVPESWLGWGTPSPITERLVGRDQQRSALIAGGDRIEPSREPELFRARRKQVRASARHPRISPGPRNNERTGMDSQVYERLCWRGFAWLMILAMQAR